MKRKSLNKSLLLILLFYIILTVGCARIETRQMEVTAYCGCKKCCAWTRGRWRYLKLNVWNRYVSTGFRKGKHYDGRTASGTFPREPNPGLISVDSITHPWMIPARIVQPWLILPHKGTIAADTSYYPFETEIHVPGYGWGIVEDRGSAIKGANRLDVYYRSHRKALKWGRQNIHVKIKRKN